MMRSSRFSFLAACFTLSALLPVSASAAVQSCTGAIWTSWVNEAGDVLISSSWRSDHTQICNLKNEWKGISVDVCIAWTAKLDAAATMNKTATIYYADAPACNALPTYERSLPPVYVMIFNS